MDPLFNTVTPAQQAANQVRNLAQSSYAQLIRTGVNGYEAIWDNPKATPEEVIAELGTDAVSMFELANINITAVASASAVRQIPTPSIPSVPDGYSLTPNADGSMTVIYLAPSGSVSGSGSEVASGSGLGSVST